MWPILIVASIVTGCFALARRKRTGSIFGAEGVATIEEARYAKNQLKRQLFANANVPWWLVGVGIGGSEGNWCVLVSAAGQSPDMAQFIPKQVGGVPVVVDTTGAQPLEMSTGL